MIKKLLSLGLSLPLLWGTDTQSLDYSKQLESRYKRLIGEYSRLPAEDRYGLIPKISKAKEAWQKTLKPPQVQLSKSTIQPKSTLPQQKSDFEPFALGFKGPYPLRSQPHTEGFPILWGKSLKQRREATPPEFIQPYPLIVNQPEHNPIKVKRKPSLTKRSSDLNASSRLEKLTPDQRRNLKLLEEGRSPIAIFELNENSQGEVEIKRRDIQLPYWTRTAHPEQKISYLNTRELNLRVPRDFMLKRWRLWEKTKHERWQSTLTRGHGVEILNRSAPGDQEVSYLFVPIDYQPEDDAAPHYQYIIDRDKPNVELEWKADIDDNLEIYWSVQDQNLDPTSLHLYLFDHNEHIILSQTTLPREGKVLLKDLKLQNLKTIQFVARDLAGNKSKHKKLYKD